MAESLEDFQPMFGKAKAEWENLRSFPLLLFMFHVHALDAFSLRVHVTDFHSYTWEATRSVVELEELRDSIGIGGSWSDFVDYLIASTKSDNVKLVLSASPTAGDKGPILAKLIAHKSRGMPRLCISLERLMGLAANNAMTSLSLELLKAFETKQNALVEDEKPSSQDPLSTKVCQWVVPAYRRAKVRGVLLQDTEGSEDN